jgi:3-methyl-2-oxobutanoate hydroxymethyltransferase
VNKKILKILKSKNKKKLVCLTAYSKPIAKILDKYCDIILVGDSVGTAMYGMKNTHLVSMDMMIRHGVSVRSNVKESLCVVDMPKNSYKNEQQAKKNAKLIFTQTKCDAVKIECNGNNYGIIKSIVDSGIPVMGHIGFTPQHYKKFKLKGVTEKDQNNLIDQAKKNEDAGVFSIVLECINKTTAQKITQTIGIPTIGIGASGVCDGQILVTDDMLGLSGFYPKFVKKFVNLNNIIEIGIEKYKKEVLNQKFPKKKNVF